MHITPLPTKSFPEICLDYEFILHYSTEKSSSVMMEEFECVPFWNSDQHVAAAPHHDTANRYTCSSVLCGVICDWLRASGASGASAQLQRTCTCTCICTVNMAYGPARARALWSHWSTFFKLHVLHACMCCKCKGLGSELAVQVVLCRVQRRDKRKSK